MGGIVRFTLVELLDSDYELIQNLIRFYIYDMSEFTGWACPANGLYGGVDDQPYYFGRIPTTKEALWPDGWRGKGYKILVGEEIAGFCLLRFFDKDGEQFNDVGEFFIIRKFRKAGLGKRVAHAVFDQYPGKWQVRQLLENHPAQQFWRKTIAEYTQGHFTESIKAVGDYGKMVIQVFTTEA